MKISIVIDNYNYPDYVQESIESALNQTYKDIEVIVVDDGSTDHCPELLQQYASRVKLVLKSNGGQASAFNAGIALATGEIVMLLDADDVLRLDAAEKVAAAWRPGMAKLHYPMELIDERSRPIGGCVPRAPLASGELSGELLERGFYVSSPTSGNAFSREVLRELLPIDEKEWRVGTDGYLVFLAPFFGTVGIVPEPIVRYRVHGKSETSATGNGASNGALMTRLMASDVRLRRTLERFAAERGLPLAEEAVYSHWLHRKLRLACFRMSREHHPFAGDTAARLAWSLMRAVWSAKELGVKTRVLFSGWGILTAFLPQSAASRLVRLAFSPASRPAALRGGLG
jgi:glycosyltransferase involved in cell wall biosynthesis